MVINISISKTLDDSVIVKKVSILWFSCLCSRGFSQVTIKKKKFLLIKTSAHKWEFRNKCAVSAHGAN